MGNKGKQFRGAHVHSIMKRKRMRDAKLEREYPEVQKYGLIFIWTFNYLDYNCLIVSLFTDTLRGDYYEI